MTIEGYSISHNSFSVQNLFDYLSTNLGVELISVGLTVFVIERIYNKQQEKALFEDTMIAMRSGDNGIALQGIQKAYLKGFLDNGRLDNFIFEASNWQKAPLIRSKLRHVFIFNAKMDEANIQLADFSHAHIESTSMSYIDGMRCNLHKIELYSVDLKHAELRLSDVSNALFYQCNLEEVDFKNCNMKGTKFEASNLTKTYFRQCDLQDGMFDEVNLSGTTFLEANLTGCKFTNVVLGESTQLPDGSLWRNNGDLERFINPDASDYWQPPSIGVPHERRTYI